MNFGNKVKILRKEMNMTQTELADKLNIGKTTVSNYETNYSTPDNDMLLKLSSVFNVSVDYLLGNSDIKNPYNTEENVESKNIDLWLSKTDGYKELPDEDKELIANIAKNLLEKHRKEK